MKRNDPASKNSKRKNRKNAQARNQRQVMVAFRPRTSSPGPIRVRFHNRGRMELDIGIIDTNGEIPCEAHSIIWAYRRNRAKKGSKVVCKIPALKGMCTENPDVHLTNYDWFFVIDTNTNVFRQKTISVSCVLGGRALVSESGLDSFHIAYIPVLFYEFWSQAEKPEPFAWKLLVHDLANDPLATAADKVAIVVDSELGNVERINKRTADLANGMELPDNYHLIYASADVRDFAINKIFRHCDKQARQFFAGLKAQYTEVGLPEVPPDIPFLRTWEFENGIRRRVLAYESSIKLGEAFQP